jgi:hypothetical protein
VTKQPDGKAEPQCRICGTISLNKCTNKAKKPLSAPTAVHIAITQRHTQPGVAERFLEDLAFKPFNSANFILWDDGESFPAGYTG